MTPSISQIKEAYKTLSTPGRRAEYDSSQMAFKSVPRPAQIISLDDFEEGIGDTWHCNCRCGGVYKITNLEMEEGHHLVGCNSCSEVIWVGYEQWNSEDEGIDWTKLTMICISLIDRSINSDEIHLVDLNNIPLFLPIFQPFAVQGQPQLSPECRSNRKRNGISDLPVHLRAMSNPADRAKLVNSR